jgi:hypothetical protein
MPHVIGGAPLTSVVRADQSQMFLDTIHGVIDRRVLLNYRIAPEVIGRVLAPPFKPKLYAGYGVGGVCMIRFKQLRPRLIPAWLGLGSENAAHRIAVQWEQDGELREGVFIPRRDTNSWFNEWHSRPDLYRSATAAYLTARPQPLATNLPEPGAEPNEREHGHAHWEIERSWTRSPLIDQLGRCLSRLSNMNTGIRGIFSNTILKWHEPAGARDFVALKEEGIKKIRGRFPSWSAYSTIEICFVDRDETNCPVLWFSPKKKKRFYLVAPVSAITVPPDVSLDAVVGVLRYKGIRVSMTNDPGVCTKPIG